MSHRLAIPAAFLLAAFALAGRATAADEDRDRWVIGVQKYEGYVVNEFADDFVYRTSAQGGTQKKKTKDVKHLVYAGMVADGIWRKAMESKDRGRYEEAAEYFAQLADSGTKEWEKAYGAVQEGDCWELAKKYSDAAKAYQKLVAMAPFDKDDKAVPRHRLWLDAAYHLGVALAEDKKADEAAKIADGLATYAKLKDSVNSSGAEARANAVRAASAGAAKDMQHLREYAQKVILRDADEPEVWFHFNFFLADTYRSANQPKDALRVIDSMIDAPLLATDPARKAEVELVRGLCLIDTDPQGAVVELLKIDLLPYGSEDQKCLARFQAGKLLLAEIDKVKAKVKPGANDADFIKELTRTARLLLNAASESTSNIPEKANAKSLLDQIGPEEGAPKSDKSAAGDQPAAADKPVADKPAAGTKPAPKAPAPKAPPAGDKPVDP